MAATKVAKHAQVLSPRVINLETLHNRETHPQSIAIFSTYVRSQFTIAEGSSMTMIKTMPANTNKQVVIDPPKWGHRSASISSRWQPTRRPLIGATVSMVVRARLRTSCRAQDRTKDLSPFIEAKARNSLLPLCQKVSHRRSRLWSVSKRWL